jgi:hypothetical protein
MWSALYVFFRDEGSIIAGVIALAAGYIAYAGATRAAKIQVDAMTVQTEALKQQNSELKIENRRRLAREEIVAVRLLLGVVKRIGNDCKNPKLIESPGLKAKPPLSVVWNHLGVCDQEIIEKYLSLDEAIDQSVCLNTNFSRELREKQSELASMAELLIADLDDEMKRGLAVLAEGT